MGTAADFAPAIGLADVRAAADAIRPHVVRTPAIPHERISAELNCRVFFKAENLQHGGAFKARGATNAVMRLSEDEAARGVVTHSSGNHAAAVARAAGLRGIPAYVVMPENSAPNKIAAVKSYGVSPVFCEPTTESRVAAAEAVRSRTGAALVHPYDSAPVMAGQGTVGLEILEQVDPLDVVFVPVGGGGLLAGVLTAIKQTQSSVAVIAVEPAWADDTARSLAANARQPPTRYDTVADGLRTSVGVNTFPIIQQWLDDIVLVAEDEIRSAMRDLAEQARLVAEPSGAVAFAGLRKAANQFSGQSVAVVVSGGNLDFGRCRLGAPEGTSQP